MNVAELLTRQSFATPNQISVIYGDKSFSYAEFEALIWGLSHHFLDCGLQQGEVVALHLEDPLLHFSALWAMARVGLIAVSVNSKGVAFDAGKALLSRVRATAVVTEFDSPDWGITKSIRLSSDQIPILITYSKIHVSSCRALDHILHYKTSSGTTSVPKIVAATHAGMIASIEREIINLGYLRGERYLTPVSLNFDGPRRRYMACLASGGTAVLPPPIGGLQAIVDTISRNDVQHFSCVPSQAYELAMILPHQGPYFPRMRCFRLSAGPSDISLHQLLRERVSTNLFISYGCAELGPLTVAPPALLASRSPTVGLPMQGVTIQIVSPEDQQLPPGTAGLIRLRAQGMPQFYHDDPVATAKFFKNGWFYPGDLGRMNEAGLLSHLGRADGMMIMDGINIYPAEIEQALMTHSAVRDAVAFPLKHWVVNNIPFCVVCLKQSERATETELVKFARSLLGPHSPKYVAILENIPRNEYGKVQRTILMQSVSVWMDKNKRKLAPTIVHTDKGLRQLSFVIKLKFILPKDLDFKRLDTWLVSSLQLPMPDQPEALNLSKQEIGGPARAWLARVLLMSRLLLQRGRIPVLDTPQVIDCQPDFSTGGQWFAHITFARIEELPLTAYNIALKGAIKLCEWVMLHPSDDHHLQNFYSQIERDTIAQLQSLWKVGKSTLPILQEAYNRSIPFIHLGAGVFQLGWGKSARRIERSITGFDSAIGSKIASDKVLTATLLRKAGLPAPVHIAVTNFEEAMRAVNKIGWPVVVKPTDRERGEGVMVNIRSNEQLKVACKAAFALARVKKIVVERQVQGFCHRLFMVNGQLLYAVKRLPMSVIGDGVSNIVALVDAEVAKQLSFPPWQRSGIQPLDELAFAAISLKGYSPTSVPDKGVQIPLRPIESTEWGGIDEDVTLKIHPENLQIARQSSELCGLFVAGVDIISQDITQPWFDNGAIINEVNYAPLLGGGEISRRAIPFFLEKFIDGNGMIPIEVFVGGERAWISGKRRWREMVASGVGAYVSSNLQTLVPSGEEWYLPFDSVFMRAQALVVSSHVQAIVLVVQTDEFLSSGLPLEAISSITIIDLNILSIQSTVKPVPRARLKMLTQLLLNWKKIVV